MHSFNNHTRIGVIYPADGFLDSEFWACTPGGVSVHFTRSLSSRSMDQRKSATERYITMAESIDIEASAGTFALINPRCVVYACTAASFIRGVGFDMDIAKRVTAESGSPATTTSTSSVAALKALEIENLAVATPYQGDVANILSDFLTGNGFNVVNLSHAGSKILDFKTMTQKQTFELAKQADSPQAQGLFIPCTALPTVGIIDALEQSLGKPVVSANQASMWHALKIAQAYTKLDNVGSLYKL